MRRFLFLGLLVGGLAVAIPVLAHEGHTHGPGPVIVVEIKDPMEQRVIDFVAASTRTPDAQVVVFRIDSPGVASGDIGPLFDAIAQAPIPVVVWVGPQNAVAYGGAAQLIELADFAGAAPGAQIGYALPTVAGTDSTSASDLGPGLTRLASDRVEITESNELPELLDVVTPSIGQFIASLDGLIIGDQVIETADQTTLVDGSVVLIPSVEVRFLKPDIFTRFLRLAIRPEAAFFFLIAGLSLVAFEFYAAGVGVTAGVAAVALFLSAYGLAVQPVRWLAVASAVFGLFLYTWDFQRNQLGLRSLLGTATLLAGGLSFTDAEPQFGPRWWAIVIVVFGVALFYLFGMTTVVRARFSTPTIGREHLVGRTGIADSDFAPDGLVSVDEARWQATAHRAAGIKKGDEVTVLGVRDIVIEVGPSDPDASRTESVDSR